MSGAVIGSISSAACFEWRIPEFFRLEANPFHYFRSPVFQFSGCTWYLKLYPEGDGSDGWVSLFLCKEYSDDVDKTVTCTPGVKKWDETLEEQESHRKTFKTKSNFPFGCRNFLRLEDLHQRKSELAPSDTLSVTCRMAENVSSGQPVEVVSGPSKLTGLETLSKNFSDLFVNKKKCDVTVKVKGLEFLTHKAVLVARSPVFAAMFEHDTLEEETGVVTVPDCDPDSFENFLHYLYTGRIESVSSRNAHHLYVTADKYDVQELKSFCGAYMKRNLSVENTCDAVTLADQYEDTELLSSAENFFNQNFAEILLTDQWETMLRNNYLLANKLLRNMAQRSKILRLSKENF